MSESIEKTYWGTVWDQYKKHRLGNIALVVLIFFILIGIYAPFLASSKPIVVRWGGEWYFPLFRYLFYSGFYTKPVDIFFNLLIFTAPLAVIFYLFLPNRIRRISVLGVFSLQCFLFGFFLIYPLKNPAADPALTTYRLSLLNQCVLKGCYPTWDSELEHLNKYAQLNMVMRYDIRKKGHHALLRYLQSENKNKILTLYQQDLNHRNEEISRLSQMLMSLVVEGKEGSSPYLIAHSKLQFLVDKEKWLEEQSHQLEFLLMPFIRPYHWEDDAGGEQSLNQEIPWWELTRINRKDLLAALIFGVRISLVVGILAVLISLIIGIPVGAYAGYYGGNFDIVVSRLLEIWESMPTFFMLLMVVAITQTKSIFIVIAVVGIFGWTTFSRYIRGEFFKQRNLPYVEACHSQGFHDSYIMFTHILPNAIPPLLTLLPFAIMGAITSEAGLSFLGLGEEGSCSWGVLMDEGRSAFPAESYLLWPPAILLTILLIAIAIVGDTLRDALDPKLQ